MGNKPVPKQAMEVLGIEEQDMLAAAVRQALLTPASPWERHKIEYAIKKRRSEFLVQFVDIQSEAVLSEVYLRARGRTKAVFERQVVALMGEQFACAVAAAGMAQEALEETMRLGEDVRELTQGCVFRMHGRYLRELEKRTGRL